MTGGVTLAVRQISSYPDAGAAGAGDLLLMQPGGLGNPYASIDAASLVETALNGGGNLGVGRPVPAGAGDGNILGQLIQPPGVSILWNAYYGGGGETYWFNGAAGAHWFDQTAGFTFGYGPPGSAGQPVPEFLTLFAVSPAGAASLPSGTLTVARDPGAALEVATMGWVGNNTVASFNGRKGVVQLTTADIYGALCLDSSIATENWVNGAIQSSIQLLLANHPFVFGWNGRTGAVYLTLADITCVFFQPGQQPITQTPPLTSNDYSIPNTAWVVEYIANEFAGGGSTLATQAWVLANTVNSFNGRVGPVTLTSSDVYDVGAAPLNSPAFSGIPTAPTAAVGQATGQIATTAFVQQAITANTAGVSTFNTRSGDVVLEAADITGAGGLANPSAALTGNPTAPTQPPGTNLPVIANCEFVMAAIAAGTVQSFNTRTGPVVLTLADVTGVGGAPLVSPAFSSVPTAPTAAPGTNTVQLATTAFVNAAVTAAGGVSSFNSRTGAVTLTPNDISAAGGLVNPSVGLTGSPTATTATAGDNSTRIATTAFVAMALASGAVTSFNTRTGAVTLVAADLTAAGGALLAGPAFTGVPTAPTAAPATNNTQIATTAYVTAAILADTTGVTSFNTRTGAITLTTADITGAGGAPLASPSFTGVPLGPTATAGTSTTQLATTAFVQAAIASSGVSSFNSRTGAVTLIANDISAAGGALLAGPTFTGVPTAPTAAPGTNTTQLATTAFVAATLGSYLPLAGGILSGRLTISYPDDAQEQFLAMGTTYGVRILTNSSDAILQAVNNPITASSAPLTIIAGSPLALQSGGNPSQQFTSGQVQFIYGTGDHLRSIGGTAGAWNRIWIQTNDRIWAIGPSSADFQFWDESAGVNRVTFSITGGCYNASGTWSTLSDASLKSDITDYPRGLAHVLKLQPRSFRFRGKYDDGKTHHGFVAQEIEEHFPEFVDELDLRADPQSEPEMVKTVAPTAMIFAVVNAIQQLARRLEALEASAGITPSAADLA